MSWESMSRAERLLADPERFRREAYEAAEWVLAEVVAAAERHMLDREIPQERRKARPWLAFWRGVGRLFR